MICFKTATSKINDLHLTPTVAFHQYVLRLQITMNKTKTMQVLKGLQALDGYRLQIQMIRKGEQVNTNKISEYIRDQKYNNK